MQHEPEGRLLDNAVAESFFASLKREMEGIDELESWEAANISLASTSKVLQPLPPSFGAQLQQPIEFELIHSVKKAA